jgi:hypothetical protein
VRPTDRDERTLEGWLRDTASPIPPEVIDASLAAIATTPQRRRRWRVWPQLEVHRLAGMATVLILAAVASAGLLRTSQPGFVPGSAPEAPVGFAGTWVTMNCAQWWQADRIDCSISGDSSELRLTIGPGEEPIASYADNAAGCSSTSVSPTRFTASGIGRYERPFLWLTFSATGCSSFGRNGDGRLQLYHDPGSDTLWEDEDGDGWGLIWRRSR